MALYADSLALNLLRKNFNISNDDNKPIIALAGNPNTGKSTIFNGLTGLRQHTGNWPGKTVGRAEGYFKYKEEEFLIIDLPGTYSLLANSTEELIARDFICFARPDLTLVVADATNLERNLNLVLQVLELSTNTILVLNLLDEARRKGIKIDVKKLEACLQVPVIPAVAREGLGLEEIKKTCYQISKEKIKIKGFKITYSREIEEKIEELIPLLKRKLPFLQKRINWRWLALRLLEGDKTILASINTYYPIYQERVNIFQKGEVQLDGFNQVWLK
ncbi:MAG TPA: iron transporter FeoB [Halanaerobiaceae bacterium]|jgi:Fe2+ transport system protein B|nr:FeoB small GTPase domain-containing protein [Bacillota bacterium]HHU91813.1 iron transporter FeoB [Halanaerobiaceae bacterium]HOA40531.1 FeoB small GTPase domain-containing protein [Halanaerobiales bacterium]HPZ62743.1 FeoB small GTPase domain-containing protein [Halanaerobiales bacterium]HQD04046.1 FeoB small GTPase domain-containing protein [Halanaerobiales bacterium]